MRRRPEPGGADAGGASVAGPSADHDRFDAERHRVRPDAAVRELLFNQECVAEPLRGARPRSRKARLLPCPRRPSHSRVVTPAQGRSDDWPPSSGRSSSPAPSGADSCEIGFWRPAHTGNAMTRRDAARPSGHPPRARRRGRRLRPTAAPRPAKGPLRKKTSERGDSARDRRAPRAPPRSGPEGPGGRAAYRR